MKVKSLKQALHWLFLAVGIFSAFMLAFSVSTYLDYAREGYGLGVSVTDAALDGQRLTLHLAVDNPGSLEMVITGEGFSLDGGTASYSFLTSSAIVDKDDVTSVTVWVDLSQADADLVRADGLEEASMDFLIYIPERDATTHLALEVRNVEVEP